MICTVALSWFNWLHQVAVEAPEIRENGKVKADDAAPDQPSNGKVENGVKNDVKNNDDNENDEGSLDPEDAEEHTLLKPGKHYMRVNHNINDVTLIFSYIWHPLYTLKFLKPDVFEVGSLDGHQFISKNFPPEKIKIIFLFSFI